jgi:hypothetical protein
MNRLQALGISLAMVVGLFTAADSNAIAPAPTVKATTTTTTVAPATTTTTTLPPAKHPECAEWLGLAVSVGWREVNLPMLERVLWKESRCLTDVHNPYDPNGGSHGLAQVNGFWCQGSRYYPQGYLQSLGILSRCDDLYEPEINLKAALAIFDYAQGWSQWGL